MGGTSSSDDCIVIGCQVYVGDVIQRHRSEHKFLVHRPTLASRLEIAHFSMRARVAMADMNPNGRRIEAQGGVKALQPLLQTGIGTQKILRQMGAK